MNYCTKCLCHQKQCVNLKPYFQQPLGPLLIGMEIKWHLTIDSTDITLISFFSVDYQYHQNYKIIFIINHHFRIISLSHLIFSSKGIKRRLLSLIFASILLLETYLN